MHISPPPLLIAGKNSQSKTASPQILLHKLTSTSSNLDSCKQIRSTLYFEIKHLTACCFMLLPNPLTFRLNTIIVDYFALLFFCQQKPLHLHLCFYFPLTSAFQSLFSPSLKMKLQLPYPHPTSSKPHLQHSSTRTLYCSSQYRHLRWKNREN